MTQTIELIQPILGLRPYVLIEAAADPTDGELMLKVNAGGGAAEELAALPFLMITELPAEQNPITRCIRDHLAENAGDREVLARFAEALGIPMPALCNQVPCEHAPDGGNHPAAGGA